MPGAGGASLCLEVQRLAFSADGVLAPITRVALPPSVAQRPRRPPPASACTCSGSARPARRRCRRLQLPAPWSPRTERLCAPVADLSPDTPGSVESKSVAPAFSFPKDEREKGGKHLRSAGGGELHRR